MIEMVRGKKFCVVKEGTFFIFEKSTSKKPTSSFLLHGAATVCIRLLRRRPIGRIMHLACPSVCLSVCLSRGF